MAGGWKRRYRAVDPRHSSKNKTRSAGRSGRSPDWLKMKNPDEPAVKREAEEDWGKGPMALKRLKQAMAKLNSDVRRDIHIFIAAIVFLVVAYFLTRWLSRRDWHIALGGGAEMLPQVLPRGISIIGQH
jgi:hypothetical protein